LEKKMDFTKAITPFRALMVAVLILTGSAALYADVKQSCPENETDATATAADQKTPPGPAEDQQTGQDNQGQKPAPPGTLAPSPFKMMDPKKDKN
jgi:hypothetical protein